MRILILRAVDEFYQVGEKYQFSLNEPIFWPLANFR